MKLLAILRKDIAEQGWVLLPAWLGAQGVLLLLLTHRLAFALPLVPAFQLATVAALVPLAWLMASRLVGSEYARGAFRVWERLPISLGALLGVKVLSGGMALGAAVAAAWLILLTSSVTFARALSDLEALETLRGALACVSAAYGYGLLAASLGRHRLLFHIAALGAAGFAWRAWAPAVPLWERPPFPGSRLLPWLAGAGALGLVLGLVLAAGGRGRLARAWQGSLRGGDLLRAGLLAGLLLTVAELSGERTSLGLEGPQARSADARVRFSLAAPEARERAQAAAEALAELLRSCEQELEVRLPPVCVDHGAGLSDSRAERAHGARRGLLLVRTDLLDPAWENDRFATWLLREALDEASEGRLRRGAWRLALDGYPGRVRPAGYAEDDAQAALRVAWGLTALEAEGLAGEALLARWGEARARVGDEVARSLACWALSHLAARDPTAPGRLTRAFLHASRAPWAPGRRAWTASLEAELGLSRAEFGAQLAAEGARLRRELGDDLAGLPRLARTELAFAPTDQGQALVFTAGPGPGRFALLHGARDPWFSTGPPPSWDRDEAPLGAAGVRSARSYPAGTRIAVAFATFVPRLGCDLIQGWRELVVP